MNLDFFVANRKLTAKTCGSLMADSTGCDTFTIAFDKEWEQLVKIVELQNGQNKVQVLYLGKMPLPAQVCGRGDLYLTCYGYRHKDDTVAVIRTMPMIRPVRMVGSVSAQGASAQPYTPSVYEQMAALVKKAEVEANRAREVTEQLLSMKEQGAFTGPAGPAGQAAAIAVESIRQGSPAKVENVGTARNALLRFTIPYAMTQEEKQQLKEELVGDLDAALEHILAIEQQLTGGECL